MSQRKDDDGEPILDIMNALASEPPLLNPGGRLVVFVPTETAKVANLTASAALDAMGVGDARLRAAGLELVAPETLCSQRLNKRLSRLLFTFSRTRQPAQ